MYLLAYQVEFAISKVFLYSLWKEFRERRIILVYNSREDWLLGAVGLIKPHLIDAGASEFPENIRVSIGFPSSGVRSKVIGECHYSAKDNIRQIFIHPKLSDVVDGVLGTLVHELIHASLPVGAKHGSEFKNIALSVGLTGKMTATTVDERLHGLLSGIAERLGDFPHSPLERSASIQKTQTTRMLKVICSDSGEDGYTVRMTRKWLDEFGAPFCPCHNSQMELVEKE